MYVQGEGWWRNKVTTISLYVNQDEKETWTNISNPRPTPTLDEFVNQIFEWEGSNRIAVSSEITHWGYEVTIVRELDSTIVNGDPFMPVLRKAIEHLSALNLIGHATYTSKIENVLFTDDKD